jgi:hypothetical protein
MIGGIMRASVLTVLLLVAGLLTACDAPRPNALPAESDDVDAILDNNTLSAQEKRVALEELGFSPVIINGLLRGERTGNQFGGDLRTAYNKVVAGTLNQLTPDEIQIYGDAAEPLAPDGSEFTFTDAQAQDIANFFDSNGVETPADLATVLGDPVVAAGLPADLDSDTLIGLFVDFDPELLLPELP